MIGSIGLFVYGFSVALLGALATIGLFIVLVIVAAVFVMMVIKCRKKAQDGNSEKALD